MLKAFLSASLSPLLGVLVWAQSGTPAKPKSPNLDKPGAHHPMPIPRKRVPVPAESDEDKQKDEEKSKQRKKGPAETDPEKKKQ